MARYIVMTASDKIPSSWKWQYPAKRVAVVKLTEDYALNNQFPKMISDRARGIERIVETWNRLRPGKTERCEYARALAAAEALAAKLNEERAAR